VSPSGHGCCGAYDPLLPDSVANGPDAVRDVVRRLVRAGADDIKTATTGGASSRPGHGPLDAAFSPVEMEALVTESHALGRRVMCHALGGPGLLTALEADVDSVEHGCYLDEDPTLLNRMAVQGTFFVPTLTVYVYHRESPAPHVRERARALHAHHVTSVQRALERGVPIAAGTDAGGHGHPHNALELKYLVEAGLSPMQALRAGTQWAARCLGLDREIGTLEKGRQADLVVVDGNPLDDVTVLLDPARIELVLKSGAICADRRKAARG
jgi:imidazolonepropionase-like amidohydrolase